MYHYEYVKEEEQKSPNTANEVRKTKKIERFGDIAALQIEANLGKPLVI